MKYDIERRVFCVKMFYKLDSYVSVKRAYRAKYGSKDIPSTNVIKNIIMVFEKNGSVATIPVKKRESRPENQ